ncbi:TonB-dependent receptor [Alteromonadaceae bacterium BrNp21-10]|nr:TonB-dependent receptor [Alteromonadaceae bacterium BrNp21-10]
MERKFLLSAFGYALVGVILGIFMASSKNHGQLVTHAHIMLLGFVVSFIYAVCHKLWLTTPSAKLVQVQYYAHQIGTLVLVVALFLMYGGMVAASVLGPILGVASILVLLGVILMKVMIIKAKPE